MVVENTGNDGKCGISKHSKGRDDHGQVHSFWFMLIGFVLDEVQMPCLDEADQHGHDHQSVDDGVGAVIDQNGNLAIIVLQAIDDFLSQCTSNMIND